MSDNNTDLAAQEVDEELRRDQLNAVWKAYGKYIVGGAVGIVIAVAGNEVYSTYEKSEQEANGTVFETAQTQSDVEGADAAQVWAEAIPNLSEGYAALAELRLAQASAKAGDIDGAIAAYDEISGNSQHDAALSGFARLMAALLVAEHKDNLDDARGRLSVLAIKGLPWYFSALEQQAFIDMQQSRSGDALSKFLLLAGDAQTPAAIKQRATQFRDMLESEARVLAMAIVAQPAEGSEPETPTVSPVDTAAETSSDASDTDASDTDASDKEADDKQESLANDDK